MDYDSFRDLYRVRYTDDDEEELTLLELQPLLTVLGFQRAEGNGEGQTRKVTFVLPMPPSSNLALPVSTEAADVALPLTPTVSSGVASSSPPSSTSSIADPLPTVLGHSSGMEPVVDSMIDARALSPNAVAWTPPSALSVFDVDAQCHELVNTSFLAPDDEQCVVTHWDVECGQH